MEELLAKYLANELSEQERTDFEKELSDNQELSSQLESALNAWYLTENAATPSFNTDLAWNKVSEKISPSRTILMRPKPRYTFLKVAATLLIVLTAGYFISDYSGLIEFSESDALTELTTVDQFEKHELPDGTKVILNANSKIQYEEGFGVEHRNLTLIGRADFDVTRNEAMPFVISTSNSTVEVLGTRFDVNAYPGSEVALNVTEGTVKFTSTTLANDGEILNAGDMGVLSEDGLEMTLGKVDNNNYTGWWTRKLVFENTPFDQVVADLKATYWVDIEFDEALKNCTLTSSVDNLTLTQALELIKATFPAAQIDYSVSKENLVKLEGKGCTE